MIKFFDDADYDKALEQYRKIKTVYLAICLFYAILMIVSVVFYMTLPYADPLQVAVKWEASVLTALFILFSFPYCGIKMHRSRFYCKMLKNISTGIKERGKAYFSHVDDWEVKDHVDVNVYVFKTWNEKKQAWEFRNVYIDAEKTPPEFEENEEIAYITEGNVLVEYERTGNFFQNITEDKTV